MQKDVPDTGTPASGTAQPTGLQLNALAEIITKEWFAKKDERAAKDVRLALSGDELEESQRRLGARVLVGNAFQLNTAVCSEYMLWLRGSLQCGESGVLVFGTPRLGKTCATRWVLKALRGELGLKCWIPWTEVPCRGIEELSKKSSGPFFRHLLSSTKYRYSERLTNDRLRKQTATHLVSRGLRSQMRTYILFFDEAHKLTEQRFEWLLELSNEMNQLGVRLFCLFVGQSELLDRRKEFINKGLEQLLERFMQAEFAFRGLESRSELEEVLHRYDEVEYPPKSGLRFPETFVPLACAAGFKLADLADPLWNEFRKIWVAAGLGESVMIPMGHLAKALLKLLLPLASRDGTDFTEELLSKAVSRAVAASNYDRAVAVRRSRLEQQQEFGRENESADD